MASYLGYSDYRRITSEHNFELASHFDQFEDQCYEKKSTRWRNGDDEFTPAVDIITGRPLHDTTAQANDAEKAGRIDMLLPVRRSGEINFQGYFVDKLPSPASEQITRRCNITLFLKDRTVRIYEPHTQNSGYLQGEFLKRSQVLNPKTCLLYTSPSPRDRG